MGLAEGRQRQESPGEAHVRLRTLVAKPFRDAEGKYRLFFGRVAGFTPKDAEGLALSREIRGGRGGGR